MLNILELTNKGDEPFRATIQLYDSKSEGSSAVALVPALTFTLPVGEKIDLPLSSIGPVTEDSIGFLEITANHGKIEGGMSVYRSNQYNPERFDFAFHSPLRTSSLGNGYTLANTFQPARTNSEPVYNWLSLANPTNTAASFTLNYYWDSGELALQRALRIPPKGRHDIDGGHSTLGANRAGMIEILPDDSTSPYIAALSRYSMVEETDEYAFAFSKSAGAAYSAAQFLAITNLEQNRSFLEIGNVLHQVSTATLSWFDSSGTLVSQNSVDLGAKSITHIQLNNHLPSGAAGSLKIEAEPAGALYLQAVSYQFNEDFGEVLEAQAAPPLSGLASELSASYNLYLGMANWARLINFSNAPIAVELIYGSDSQSLEIALGVNARRDIGLHELGLSTDTYGPITLKSSKAGALGGEVVRSRKDSSGQFELLTTIPLR
jgi:hypothetical protein